MGMESESVDLLWQLAKDMGLYRVLSRLVEIPEI